MRRTVAHTCVTRSYATFARARADDARVEGARRRDDEDSFALRLACAHRFARIARARAPRDATCASRSSARRSIDAFDGDAASVAIAGVVGGVVEALARLKAARRRRSKESLRRD